MFGNLLKLAGAGYALNYAYTTYIKGSQGAFNTALKIVRDLLQKPGELFAKAEASYINATTCHDVVNQAKHQNMDRSFLNPLKYTSIISHGVEDLKCYANDVQGIVYLGQSLAVSSALMYAAYKTSKVMFPLCKQMALKLYNLTLMQHASQDKDVETTTKKSYQPQIEEFQQIYTILAQKHPLELSSVVLKGHLPFIELKTSFSVSEVVRDLKEKNLNIRSFEFSPEGKCLKIHIETKSAMDLCLVF
jgi:hypothetical protein